MTPGEMGGPSPKEMADKITRFGALNTENAGEQKVEVGARLIEKKLIEIKKRIADQGVSASEMIKILGEELERAKENLVLVGDTVSGAYGETIIPRFVTKPASEVGNKGSHEKTLVKKPGLLGKMLGKKGEVTETRSVRNDDWVNARNAQRSLKEEVLLLEKVIDEMKKTNFN